MIRGYLSKNKKYICFKISGPNFSLIKDVLKENNFHFSYEDDCGVCQTLYWYGSAGEAATAINELKRIEPLNIPDECYKLMYPEPETEYFRVSIDNDCLKKPPLGQYQTDTIKKGISQSRCYLAHKQGLGKTYMTFSILNHLWKYNLIDKVLIVCRPEGVYNLKRELLVFNTIGLCEDDIYVASATNRRPFDSGAKVVISNYRTFLMLCADEYKRNHGKTMTAKSRILRPPIDLSDWGSLDRCLILDEAHSVKNRQAGQTKCLIQESEFFRFRYLLSGTPYPKGIDELWAQFQILDKNIINKSYQSWVNDVAVIGTKFSPYAIRYFKPKQVEKFVEKIKPWMVRVFAEGNLNLPELLFENIYIEMSNKQRDIYKQFVSYRLKTIMKDNKMTTVMREVYFEFAKIQEALSDPCLLKGKLEECDNKQLVEMVDKWKFEDNTRVEVCASLIENILEKDENAKVILWSGHPDTIIRLGEYFKKYKPILIHGNLEREKGVPRDEQIDGLVEEFKQDKKSKLLIASYLMISTSKNIEQASSQIWFDRPFSYELRDQAIARNRRPTSKFDSVVVYDLIANRSLDEKQMKLLSQRETLDKELLNIDSLSKEQWKKIFEGEDL